MESIKLGSRVQYKENTRTDLGTIVDIVLDDNGPFIVKWDHSPHPDEKVDGYKANQLTLVSY